jgi:glycosyltransferase involved in cell wall biosynthesis
MREGLRRRGWPVAGRELDGPFPYPTAAGLKRAAAVFADIPDLTPVLVDGLALGAMPDVIEPEASRLPIVALVHLPLGADLGVDRETRARLAAAERRALAAAALVIVTGTATLPMLAPYGIARDRIAVVEPGTDKAAPARGSGGTPVRLLTVATLNPGKGHELLLEALAALPHRRWQLTCAGSTSRHPDTTERVRAAIGRLDLGGQVTLAGELDASALNDCYDAADVFVLATLQETYGMAVAEALARGLPIVSTTTGAIPDLVGDAAGLLTPPGDVKALSTALARITGDARLRARLADGAKRAGARLPTWEQASERMAVALDGLDAHG